MLNIYLFNKIIECMYPIYTEWSQGDSMPQNEIKIKDNRIALETSFFDKNKFGNL